MHILDFSHTSNTILLSTQHSSERKMYHHASSAALVQFHNKSKAQLYSTCSSLKMMAQLGAFGTDFSPLYITIHKPILKNKEICCIQKKKKTKQSSQKHSRIQLKQTLVF